MGVTSGGAREPREIRVEIGTLVLDGFHGDSARVLAVFEHELARLVREHGVPLAGDGRTHRADTVGGLPPLPRTVSASRLGEALARSVHAGLGGGGRPDGGSVGASANGGTDSGGPSEISGNGPSKDAGYGTGAASGSSTGSGHGGRGLR